MMGRLALINRLETTMTHWKGWTVWNVGLWIANDEGLYRFALDCIKQSQGRKQAAEMMLEGLHECNNYKTPDGAVYSVSNIQKGMVELT